MDRGRIAKNRFEAIEAPGDHARPMAVGGTESASLTLRPDIEGLRALSIVFVLVYHYAPMLLPGGYVGVDVFFVISGYLITLSLLDHGKRGDGIAASLLAFWARRARRLLPNALLVLVAVSAAGLGSMSDYALKRLGSDVSWAATYAVNWLFVLRSLDYLQWDDTKISVLLNYWSLAVEEQFYFVWPIVLLLALARRGGDPRRFLPLTGLLAAASLTYCLVLSTSNLTLGFLSSPARAWELLVGAALALMRLGTHGRLSPPLPPPFVGAASALSLVAMLSAALSFSEDTLHPGWPTLLPVAGAAGVIAFGAASPAAQRWLGCAPLRVVGARSYSIYLWHWPVFVLGRPWVGAESGWGSWLLLGLSLLLAELAYRFVEVPARFRWGRGWPALRVLLVAAAAGIGVALVGLGLRASGAANLRELLGLGPGGAASNLAQAVQQAVNDLPTTYRLGCHLPLEQVEQGDCVFGQPAGTQTAVLFGDSHAAQWFPALDIVARESGYRLLAWTKSGCPSADVSIWNQVAKGPYRQCDEWREKVFRRIEAVRPRLVVVSNLIEDATALAPQAGGDRPVRGREAQAAFQAGLERSLDRLKAAGATVVVIRDTPRTRPDVMTCLGTSRDERKCELSLAEAVAAAPLDVWAAGSTGARLWDLTPSICAGAGRCPVVAGTDRTIVYRDSNHLSATFAQSLAPDVGRLWRETLAETAPSPGRR